MYWPHCCTSSGTSPWVILEATNLVSLKNWFLSLKEYIYKRRLSLNSGQTQEKYMILEIDSGLWFSANHLVDGFLAAARLGVHAGPVELTRPSASPHGGAESRESYQVQLYADRTFQCCWGSDS